MSNKHSDRHKDSIIYSDGRYYYQVRAVVDNKTWAYGIFRWPIYDKSEKFAIFLNEIHLKSLKKSFYADYYTVFAKLRGVATRNKWREVKDFEQHRL